MAALKADGLEEVPGPGDVGARADILITCLIDETQTDAVVIITSALSPTYCQALAEEAAGHGITVLDCPVRADPFGARQASLALICGSGGAIAERCRLVLESIGAIHHCGPVGRGVDTLMTVLSQSMGNSAAGENWDMFASNWPHTTKLGKKKFTFASKPRARKTSRCR